MKSLKFVDELAEMVLSGKKDTTWRINDEKNLCAGEKISLCRTNGEEFTKAEILWAKSTLFRNLTREDWEGHEKFNSEKEMYKTYSGFYGFEVTPETELKVIKFKKI